MYIYSSRDLDGRLVRSWLSCVPVPIICSGGETYDRGSSASAHNGRLAMSVQDLLSFIRPLVLKMPTGMSIFIVASLVSDTD